VNAYNSLGQCLPIADHPVCSRTLPSAASWALNVVLRRNGSQTMEALRASSIKSATGRMCSCEARAIKCLFGTLGRYVRLSTLQNMPRDETNNDRPMFFSASSSWARTRLGFTSTEDRQRRLRGPRPHSRVRPKTCSVVEMPFSPARTLHRARWSHLLRRSRHGTVSSPLAGVPRPSQARRKPYALGSVTAVSEYRR
jgi:hypothetical protein